MTTRFLLLSKPPDSDCLKKSSILEGDALVDQAREIVCRICLRIEINQQRSVAFGSIRCGKIAGNAGFSNAPFLMEYNTTHGACSSMKKAEGRLKEGVRSRVNSMTVMFQFYDCD